MGVHRRSMELMGAKVVVLILLGLLQLLFGLLPLLFHSLLQKELSKVVRRSIGVALCAGGGILISTIFIHMMKEVKELLAKTHLSQSQIPLPELLLCTGFLLILIVESVVHKVVVSSSMPGHSHLPPLSPNIKTVHLQQLPNGSKKKQSSGDFPEFFQLHSEKKKSEGCLN